ncbi:MAG: chemoreceptor glutamine deamidase CheD [Oceanospirillaceae bacterium]|jgi:chemotaxis protein CheD|nr:chemoreceptor glutamine deamidase CheD [Oceanospirillaceae bacterium]MBT4442898.1 chemoreceptor glutamine deamidase CheD [Oceanospirillaceae bacterium]MBT6077423.1 chemoreceptor glutamine deamidase CheD [Oceanospirillaceae bacterium]MBT7330941.1 chemoreceptor glutamine deamidase CheD [Oceanospirillaceae bacterium]
MAGFESVKRYWDNAMAISTAKLMPGEVYVSGEDEMIMTVLGSCVSACIRNPRTNIGGMNHFMLPQMGASASMLTLDGTAARYGNWAMEVLINEILNYGGSKRDLEVKLFGGGKVLDNMTMDIGKRNIDFVFSFLDKEGINVVAHDVGDRFPRKLLYFPNTGKVRVRKLQSTNQATIVRREAAYLNDIKTSPRDGDIDLF